MRRRTALIFALVAVLAVLAGCSATDYGLSCDITGVAASGSSATVYCTLTNTGNRTLINATTRLDVTATRPSGGYATGYAWTSMTDLEVGEQASFTLNMTLSNPDFTAAYVLPIQATVTAMGWDDSGDDTFF